MAPKEDKSLSRVIVGLAENTGMHGLPNIYRSGSIFRKTVWMLVLCAGISFMIWQLYLAFTKYYDYPADTTITTGTKTAVDFPSVSICNLNPMRKSFLAEAGPEFAEHFGDQPDDPDDWDLESSGRPPKFFDWDTQDNDDNFYESEDSDFTDFETFLDLTANLTQNQLREYGHQIEWMLLDCSFLGRECSPRNFTHFYNSIYGNCYTFNSGNESNTLTVSKVGPLYGLTLTLFIEQDEYVEGLADGAGARVTIHNQSSMPFPEDEGFSAAPGFLTYVGLERTEVQREDPPHGECTTVADGENQLKNLWRSRFDWIAYTSEACKKTCYQLHVVDICSCSDSDYPNSGTAVDYVTGVDDVRVRPCNSESEEECLEEVAMRFQRNQLNCTAHCKKECFSVEYTRHSSFARYPSEARADQELEVLLQRDENLFDKLVDNPERNEYLRKNIVKLRIYFKTLDYNSIITKASYSVVDLLSDIGGQVGLWLGLSVITIFEFLELIWDICTLCFSHHKVKASGRERDEEDTKSTVGLHNGSWTSTTKISLHGTNETESNTDQMPSVNNNTTTW